MKKIITVLSLVVLFCSMGPGECEKKFPSDPNSEHYSFFLKVSEDPKTWSRLGGDKSNVEYVSYDTIDGQVRVMINFNEYIYLYFWLKRMPQVGVSYQIPQSDVVFLGTDEPWLHYLPNIDRERYGYSLPYEGTFKFRSLRQDPQPPHALTIGLEGEFVIEYTEINYGRKYTTYSHFGGSLFHPQDPLKKWYGANPYKGVYEYPHLIDSVIRGKPRN